MAERIYVALDLETTGLDSNRDTIIEIGAIRFQGNKILDSFSTLVNPLRPIPARIQQITGIRDADVASAPTLERVLPELLAFVGYDVAGVVAHNAPFDLGFLAANGVRFHRPAFDTFELAQVVLPGQASYNLGELCRGLDIALVEAHRAPDDALATAHLFIQLNTRLCALHSAVIHAMVISGQESDWPIMQLFRDAQQATPRLEPGDTGASHAFPLPSLPNEHFNPPSSLLTDTSTALESVPAALVSAVFTPGGALAQLMGDGFEVRHGQADMAQRVLKAFNVGDHLMVEAGTGTGKSLAYLLPAALWSVINARRVVIATNTIALQDQLLDKDLPQVQAILANNGHPAPRAALLKGRGNYLCLRRLQAWRSGRQLSPAELSILARVLVWLPTTQTGDMSGISLFTAADREIWAQICSDPATCSPERCGAQSNLRHLDFFYRARQAAENAHVVVVNHALLLADIAAGGRVMPPYSHLVVDEAHRLEEAATDQLTYRVAWPAVLATLRPLARNGELLEQISAFAQRQLLPIQQTTTQMSSSAERAVASLRAFSEHLLHFARGQSELRNEVDYAQRLALDSRVRSQPLWSQVEIEWDNTTTTLRTTRRAAGALAAQLEAAGWAESEPYATLLSDLVGVTQRLDDLLTNGDEIIFSPAGEADASSVHWLELTDSRATVALASAPLHVNEIIQAELLHRRRSVIFTGATLRAGANFSFIRERLGLWDVSTAIVDSPFDYKRSTLLFLPSDIAMPNNQSYQPAVERAIAEAAEACQGRTLALFTSYAQLRTTADAIRGPLERQGILLLQHGNASRHRLLREFRATERAVLLGTRSFWEGIDLPGDELRCLLIVRLPFAVPNDPLVAARSAECEDAFSEYTLPDAILRFRQGFGRLIRRATDRGVVILLDSRIWRKDYGQAFLDALPTCTTRHAPLSILASEIRKWLAVS